MSKAGIAFAAPAEVLAKCLTQVLYRRAGSFVGIQETRALLTKIQSNYADLVKETEEDRASAEAGGNPAASGR